MSQTVEGLERYPVNLRYLPELRDDPEKLKRVLVPTPRGEHVPLGQLAELRIHKGPPAIKSENARLNAWIQVSIREDEVDMATYVKRARQAVAEKVELPAGYSIKWSGRYGYMERAQQRLTLVIPFTLLIIFFLLYIHFKNLVEVFIVLLTIPFALAELAAETGIVMLVYLDEVYERHLREGRMNSITDLYGAIAEGAVMRERPKLMTVLTTIFGLLPVMVGNVFESSSEVMQRIAAPMVGGLVSSTVLTLLIIPSLYMLWKGFALHHEFSRVGLPVPAVPGPAAGSDL